MKTKIFLLVSLFAGILTVQLSAQNGKNGNGNYNETETIVGNTYDFEVVCGDEVVDVLNFPSSFDLRVLIHFKNGIETWGKYKLNNFLMTSKLTGEVFNTQSTENDYSYVGGSYFWHLNLNGNMGHQYIIDMEFETTNWELVNYRSVCH
jgi:hypothetical protein